MTRLILKGSCSYWLGLKTSLPIGALHERNLELIREDLEQCDKFHGHESIRNDSFLPTRLIDVGDEGLGINPRLVITDALSTMISSGMAFSPRYAALSYCWGPTSDSATQFKTETHSLSEYLVGFPIETTSKVIRDAIIVARALSIPYLWIDAVCIIQDDQTDWEKESALMADIYRHAYFTICTPTSSSCRQGFLARQPPDPAKLTVISFESKIDKTVKGLFNIREVALHPGLRKSSQSYSLDTIYSQWNQRGWTLQETVLSTRLLVFGPSGVHFECPLKRRSEDGTHG